MSAGDLRLEKRLGQHFLTRPEACAPLLEFLRPADRSVIEIGPGDGALTGQLLDAGATVVAWELDPRWAARLAERFPGRSLEVVVGDATRLPWDRLAEGSMVAGNLPYNVATPIVRRMLAATVGRPQIVERAGFLVQREVGERLAAEPGGSAYGSLSVTVQTLARVEILGVLPPGAFRPPPKVDSAFVGLTPRPVALEPPDWRRFERLVQAAFARRRKTLRNSLSGSFDRDRVEALLAAAGLDRTVRAESLAPADFLELFGYWLRIDGEAPDSGSSNDRA